jgi:uncharacterized Fe-S cluster protein YjdI
MAAQEYRGTAFAISYDGDVCTHAGNCVKNKPGIFNGDNDPWINPDGGTLEEAKQAIRDCPSGALTLRML